MNGNSSKRDRRQNAWQEWGDRGGIFKWGDTSEDSKLIINFRRWLGFLDNVKQFVQSRQIFSKIKPLGKKRGKISVRDGPYKPIDLISISYLTELPISSEGKKHVLVVNDQFSKYIQI